MTVYQVRIETTSYGMFFVEASSEEEAEKLANAYVGLHLLDGTLGDYLPEMESSEDFVVTSTGEAADQTFADFSAEDIKELQNPDLSIPLTREERLARQKERRELLKQLLNNLRKGEEPSTINES